MAFEKGKEKTGGRRPGSTNKASKDLREFVGEALDSSREQILKDLAAMEPAQRVHAWLKLAEFILPKLTRSQVGGVDGGPIEVTAIRFIDDSDDEAAVAELPQPETVSNLLPIGNTIPQPIQAALQEQPQDAPDPEQEVVFIARPHQSENPAGKKEERGSDASDFYR